MNALGGTLFVQRRSVFFFAEERERERVLDCFFFEIF